MPSTPNKKSRTITRNVQRPVPPNKKNAHVSFFLEEMNTTEVEAALERQAPLFLPLGTLEAHGRHLPVGSDTLLAKGVAVELARRFSGIVAPALGYGLTNLLAQTAPASFYDESLYEAFVGATIEHFIRHGFQRIVLVNGHGGNRDALKHAARKLVRRERAALAVVNWWLLAEEPARAIYGDTGGHAAVEETAGILFFHPELVNPDLYNPEMDDMVPEDGIWCYPPPGEVLLYKGEGKGRPDFDAAKARTMMTDTLASIETRLQRWLAGLTRYRQGDLRP